MATCCGYQFWQVFLIILVFFGFCCVDGRRHKLRIEGDGRKQISMTTFGFLKGGYMFVNITGMSIIQGSTDIRPEDSEPKQYNFGFTLDKTVSTGISPFLEGNEDHCILQDEEVKKEDKSVSVIFFRINFHDEKLMIEKRGDDFANLSIYQMNETEYNLQSGRQRRSVVDVLGDLGNRAYRAKRGVSRLSIHGPKRSVNITTTPTPATTAPSPPPKPAVEEGDKPSEKANQTAGEKTPLDQANQTEDKKTDTDGKKDEQAQKSNDLQAILPVTDSISFKCNEHQMALACHAYFLIEINHEQEEGLYNFYFHNCGNYESDSAYSVNFTAYMVESNAGNYLSAGQIPLPTLYFTLCVVYFLLASYWLYLLKRTSDDVFKLHYLMLVLVYVKSVAILFHGVNYTFIQVKGHREEAFAILYYITYLMKGTLLFVTVVLIGSGWTFVKHILSDRDKKIFIVVIPLQILANVAQIIIEETEEGQSQYITWTEVFILVDLLCCGAILFPVVWSIRHLQEASQTDGKAAINLAKLKIFRHFYILIVCYIYFTRIIVYLLKITVPFEYEWINELFKEIATLIFFIITGYKFKPASSNPYFQLSQEDDDMEMDEVVTKSGAYEGLTHVNVRYKDPDNEGSTASTLKQRENSHEYD